MPNQSNKVNRIDTRVKVTKPINTGLRGVLMKRLWSSETREINTYLKKGKNVLTVN